MLGKTGSGKTYAAKGIVEHLMHRKRQVCVLDPTGAWWGLRLGADSKGRGYEVVLLGGEHADIPLAPQSGASVARLVSQQHASVVIDTSGLTVGEYTRWFTDFAEILYTTINAPLHLVIDEAHYFMPESGRGARDPQAAKMLHSGNRLMSGGRSRGIQGMLITQRPAKLHKDSLTCADTLIAMRVIGPQDRAAIKDWIDGAGDPKQGKEVLDSLAQLQKGEGWVWYPEGGHLERVKFPKITTYDSSAAPTHGAKAGPQVSEIKLDEVRAALAEAVAEAEANDPKKLRAEIAKLKAEIGKKPTVVDQGAIERAVKERDREWEKAIGDKERIIGTLTTKIKRAVEVLHVNGEMKPRVEAPAKVAVAAIAHKPQPAPRREAPTHAGDTEVGRGGLRRILIALAQRPGLTNRQIGVRAGLASSGGTFTTYMSKARSMGWLRDDGERRFITPDGETALGHFDPPPTGQDLLSFWLGELGNSGAARILRVLADAYPNEMSNEEVGQAAGLAANAGTFTTYMSKLRTLELVQSNRGMNKVSDELFE